jgi:hypothetical protein
MKQSKEFLIGALASLYYSATLGYSIILYFAKENSAPISLVNTSWVVFQLILFLFFLVTTYLIYRVIRTGKVYVIFGNGSWGLRYRETNRAMFNAQLGIRIFFDVIIIVVFLLLL